MGELIRLPKATHNGLYVGFEARPERIAKGCKITTCGRCGRLTGHWPRDSIGHEIICLGCGNDVPAIRRHIDELAKARGE